MPSTPGAASRLSAKNASRSRSTLMWCRSAVSFSSFLSLAAFRTRSSACDTRSRPWVRCVLCSLAFPLAPALCSTNSAASETPCLAWALASALFIGFPPRIAGSDFSRSCIVGYGSSPSRRGPAALDRAVDALPVPRDKERLHMPGSLTTPGRTAARAVAPVHIAFHYCNGVGTRNHKSYAAQWLACALPYRRFAIAGARLGADAVRYSFIVADFHRLLLAGLTGALSCSFNTGH